MTRINTAGFYALFCIIFLLIKACITAPVELSLKKEITVGQEEVRDIAEKVYDQLVNSIDFEHPPGSPGGLIDPQECKKSFETWLRKAFDVGQVPHRMITPLEYGRSSSDPKIGQCRTIDLVNEYETAIAQASSTTETDAMLFTFDEFQKDMDSNECIEEFLDPDEEKIEISGINAKIIENTLSIPIPPYTIYTSNESLTLDELSETDAEQTLVDEGALMMLAEMPKTQPFFTGNVPLDLVPPKEKYYSEVPVVSLSGSLVAIPELLGAKAEIKTVDGQQFFVVPKGHARLHLSVDMRITGTLKDAKCMLERFKKAIREQNQN